MEQLATRAILEKMRHRFVLGRQSSKAPEQRRYDYDNDDDDDDDYHGQGEDGSGSVVSLPEDLDKAMMLLFLSSKGDVQGIEELLAQGSDVNGGDFDDRTALHVAACEGHSNVVNLLLKHGANFNARDRWGSTPLLDAKHYGNKEVCEILEKAGATLPKVSKQAPMQVANVADVPEYEVHAEELLMCKPDPKLPEYTIAKWHGTQVAVKEIPCDLSNQPQIVSVFRRELALLQKLRHPNIVQFLGAVTQSTPMRIIVEHCAGGDLHWYLDQKDQLELVKAVRYALDIARGLNYLHQWKPEAIFHSQLRPRNILRDRVGCLKVADFQLGQILKPSSEVQPDAKNSAHHYMAPERLLGKAFDKKVDVYSFGLILYQMIEGTTDFFSKTEEELIKVVCDQNQRPPFKMKDKYYPDGLKELIQNCWHKDPTIRPEFGEIINELVRIKPLCVKQSFWRRMLRSPKRNLSLRSLSFR